MNISPEVVLAISNLVSNLNDKVIMFLSILIVIYLLLKNHMDNKQKRHYFDTMVKEKNKEIEHLADEIRRYRDIYLPKAGFPIKDLEKVASVSKTVDK